ncbi:MAG: ATP-binding protein [Nannocystaceae bacterium]
MTGTELAPLLERLIAQFASPYDFLRELVQNAMDAGSDRVEVTLETHPASALLGDDAEVDDDAVVFELIVADTGAGMDEAIIDEQLTRLFSSSKSDDRTMAGGFGIGFVSVFAWHPELALLHTGRAGESWELVFYPDRRFEKRAIATPIEGTTLTLLRRGLASERAAIARAVRDSLWRWCRFCPIEITLEALDDDEPPELIQDSMAPPEHGLVHIDEDGDHAVQVAFAVPPAAVLMRRGLILSEGTPRALLPSLVDALGESVDHLQLWADSPDLRTTLARDKVVEDDGRARVEARVLAAVHALRGVLIDQLTRAADGPGPWTEARHERFAHLHAHLKLERAHLTTAEAEALRTRPLLRDLARERPLALAELARRVPGGAMVHAPPTLADPSRAPTLATDDCAVFQAARALDVPVIAGHLEDRGWLERFADDAGVPLVELHAGLWRVPIPTAQPEPLIALLAATTHALRACGALARASELCCGAYGPDTEHRPSLVGVELGREGGHALVLHAPAAPRPAEKGEAFTGALWLDEEDPIVRAALKAHASAPATTILTLAAAIASAIAREPPDPEALLEAVERAPAADPAPA